MPRSFSRTLRQRNMDKALAERGGHEPPRGNPCAFCGRMGDWQARDLPDEGPTLVCPRSQCQRDYERERRKQS